MMRTINCGRLNFLYILLSCNIKPRKWSFLLYITIILFYSVFVFLPYYCFPHTDRENVLIRENRRLDLSNFTEYIQQRIHQLQFPTNCSQAKKLLCHTWSSGFGSQMHLRGLCLIIAYITGRTLVPNPKDIFPYSPLLGWEGYFMPITNCSISDIVDSNYQLTDVDGTPKKEVLEIDYFKFLSPKKLSQVLPSNFSDTLSNYHSDTRLFLVGQFETYLNRYRPFLKLYVSKKMDQLGFHEPIVGIHVRRTDKLKKEAQKFELSEYMMHVEAWFNKFWVRRTDKRRVFLLTDEQEVIDEALQKYPEYKFVYEYPLEQNSTNLYDDNTLMEIVSGVHMLARCTYVVCTFSSNVCTLAYELAQVVRSEDSTDRFLSLDRQYSFYGKKYV